MLLNDIGDYLSTGGVGTLGTDLFLGMMPPNPDLAICVYEAGGLASLHAMGNVAGQAKVERPRIQVVVRGGSTGYENARALAQKAFKLLDGLPNRAINGTTYFWGAAVQPVFLMGRDGASHRPLLAFNVDILKELSSTS